MKSSNNNGLPENLTFDLEAVKKERHEGSSVPRWMTAATAAFALSIAGCSDATGGENKNPSSRKTPDTGAEVVKAEGAEQVASLEGSAGNPLNATAETPGKVGGVVAREGVEAELPEGLKEVAEILGMTSADALAAYNAFDDGKNKRFHRYLDSYIATDEPLRKAKYVKYLGPFLGRSNLDDAQLEQIIKAQLDIQNSERALIAARLKKSEQQRDNAKQELAQSEQELAQSEQELAAQLKKAEQAHREAQEVLDRIKDSLLSKPSVVE